MSSVCSKNSMHVESLQNEPFSRSLPFVILTCLMSFPLVLSVFLPLPNKPCQICLYGMLFPMQLRSLSKTYMLSHCNARRRNNDGEDTHT